MDEDRDIENHGQDRLGPPSMYSTGDRSGPAVCSGAPHAWIDATRPASGRRLWGMNLVERQVRELARLGVSQIAIWTSAQTEERVRRLRSDLHSLYEVELSFCTATNPQQMYEVLREVEEGLLLLEGDVVYDERVLDYLLRSGEGTAVSGERGVTVLYLEVDQARRLGEAVKGLGIADVLLAELGLRICRPADLEHYIPSLRLTMTPFMLRVPAEGEIRLIDHLMYQRTFKGVIDGVARYGYYHLVRWITRQLSETALTPNLFTVLSILSIWGAIPCFASGHFGWGVLVAWLGVILDSVDGKLARLRLHLSDVMGEIEHIAAMPGLGLWYMSMGWYLTGGELASAQGIALATWVLIAAFLLDKIASGGFKALYGKELFDYQRLDAAFHLIAARRNISLSMLTLGTLTGHLEAAFVATAGWTVATLVFHLLRFIWIFAARNRERVREEGAGF